MSVFSAGELLGVDSRTTLRKMAVGENDPADPNALKELTQKAQQGGDRFSQPDGRAPVHTAPPPPSAVSAVDAAKSSGTPAAALQGMQEDIQKKIEGLFLASEAAHYGTRVPATTTASTTTGSGGSGSGGGTGMG